MKIKVKKSSLEGEIQCPPSKSYTHRALVISSLAAGKSNLNNILISRDTNATINCCRMLGVNIVGKRDDVLSHNLKNVTVTSEGGSCGFITPNDVLQSDNSGTTIRLLTSVCALVSDGYSVLTGDDSLRRRPMGDLIKALNQLGVTCFSTNSNYFPPVIVKGGGIEGGITQISGQISSQFISSLLLSSIFSKKGTTIQVLGNQVSKPYIESTIHIMKYFGVDIINEINYSISENFAEAITEMESPKIANVVTEEYIVPPNLVYKAKDFDVPGDFSTASLLMAAAILTKGNLTIKGLNFDMPQGDMAIIDILRKMGCQVTIDRLRGSLNVEGNSKLQGGIFDLRKTPDLLPVLAILSLVAKGETHIHGISHARYKETDRVANIASQLRRFGAYIVEKEDSIIIKPPQQIRGASIESFKDHRLFMAFTIAGLATENSSVDGAESVDVSYPQFVSDLKRVGADIQTVGTS
ncbi:3-phosphoshikimate 1-carboxyvinyltransferase [Candidatus Nitrosocosmicus franklandus]|uniref:3-phosphoshikimate 1-carboxyvinyltransferase n=1 Tax=Candidatus Nitrosocosmicus franklandianus TaxID=1798806 RepID=A0A484IBP3_9ARCH|nr:3-phosphoshikimate 1-carboxyvinyltransferase [Candidatus Nitrosocosmicus franklandus]VFJ12441.1 3-phosphoshikimate 1-carboxyvinyltransferase [Candidatus Nitrosocosmicus franklandus]